MFNSHHREPWQQQARCGCVLSAACVILRSMSPVQQQHCPHTTSSHHLSPTTTSNGHGHSILTTMKLATSCITAISRFISLWDNTQKVDNSGMTWINIKKSETVFKGVNWHVALVNRPFEQLLTMMKQQRIYYVDNSMCQYSNYLLVLVQLLCLVCFNQSMFSWVIQGLPRWVFADCCMLQQYFHELKVIYDAQPTNSVRA